MTAKMLVNASIGIHKGSYSTVENHSPLIEFVPDTSSILAEEIPCINLLTHVLDLIDHTVGENNVTALLERI